MEQRLNRNQASFIKNRKAGISDPDLFWAPRNLKCKKARNDEHGEGRRKDYSGMYSFGFLFGKGCSALKNFSREEIKGSLTSLQSFGGS